MMKTTLKIAIAIAISPALALWSLPATGLILMTFGFADAGETALRAFFNTLAWLGGLS
jgi:hypothetical protein